MRKVGRPKLLKGNRYGKSTLKRSSDPLLRERPMPRENCEAYNCAQRQCGERDESDSSDFRRAAHTILEHRSRPWVFYYSRVLVLRSLVTGFPNIPERLTEGPSRKLVPPSSTGSLPAARPNCYASQASAISTHWLRCAPSRAPASNVV